MKLSLRIALHGTMRRYATRRPERPPPKIKDPLSSPNAIHSQVAPNLTFIQRPPPTAPTPYSLSTAPSSPLLLPPTTLPISNSSILKKAALPPPIQKPHKKPEVKLTDEQIEEIRRLREADPIIHTRQKLARQFGCLPSYIPMIAPLRKVEMRKALARREQEHEANRSRWGERKAMVVAIRKKRRSLW